LSRRRIIGGVVLILLAVVAIFAWQAMTASRSLLDARQSGELVQQRVRAGDFDGASRALADLREHSSRAQDATDGPLWDLGSHIPYVGRNIGALQTVSRVLDTDTRVNAPIALQLSRAVDEGRFRPRDGRFDIAEVERLAPALRRAATSIDRAARDLASTEADELLFPFNDLVGTLQDQVDRARSAAAASADAFELLPGMLGRDGPRTYLLMIQNPAELRSTGGLPGSLALLHVNHGKVTMGWQGSPADIFGATGPVKLRLDTQQQYGPTVGTDLRDSLLTPDFPEAARIAKTMTESARHVKLDGVVSVDPIALSGMMLGSGPVSVTGGVVLNADNVVPVLLNQTYQVFDTQDQQNGFFEGAARKVFDSVMAGRGNQQQAIRGLATAASQHRVLVWSTHADEQAVLAPTAVSGALAGKSGSNPEVGIYLNDSTAGKMDYYLQYRTSAAAVDCRRDDVQDIRANVALTSTMPADFRKLSPWILGNGQFAKQGTIAFNLRIYAPYGGEVTALTVDGQGRSVTADKHHGRQVALLPMTLTPGQTTTVTADVRTAAGQSGDGVLSFTPGIVPAPNGVKIASACHSSDRSR
jgi:Protein of unknown function (DUF4012)